MGRDVYSIYIYIYVKVRMRHITTVLTERDFQNRKLETNPGGCGREKNSRLRALLLTFFLTHSFAKYLAADSIILVGESDRERLARITRVMHADRGVLIIGAMFTTRSDISQ